MTARAAAALAALLVLGTAACDRGDSGGGASTAGPADAAALPDTASDPGARTARALVGARSLDDAVTATQEALSRGGIVVTDFNAATRPATGPASPVLVVPPEAVQLAAEARRRATHSHLTLEELAALLGDMGWPWREDRPAGEQLRGVVTTWVREARRRPDDPHSFTPLFLADMARRQRPAVDLADSVWSARDLRLSFLETQLILAAFAGRRDGAPATTTGLRGGHGASGDGIQVHTAAFSLSRAAVPVPIVEGPCDAAKEWFGSGLGGQLYATGGQWGVGEGLKKGLEGAGLSEAGVEKVGRSLDALAAALKIVKMAQLYSSGQVAVVMETETPAHRPASNESDKYATVVARAGIDAKEYEEYQRKLRESSVGLEVRNCLETLGLPAWSELGDIAADADKWIVRWHIDRGGPEHVLHIVDRNDWYLIGQRAMQLKRASPSSAEARYTVQLVREKAADHPGEVHRGDAVIRAEVDVAQMPGVSLFSDVALGGVMGLAKSLVELGVGWVQTMAPLEASVTLPVLYHEEGVPLHIVHEGMLEYDTKGAMMLGVAGSARVREVYTGTISMGEDSVWRGSMTLGSEGRYSQPDAKAAEAMVAKAEAKSKGGGLEALAAPVEMLAGLADIPSCKGSFYGAQVLRVEGWPIVDAKGRSRIELNIMPAEPPASWESTGKCPWQLDEIDGMKVVPANLVKGMGQAALTIDPPSGSRRIIRDAAGLKGMSYSTVITVGAIPE